MPILKLTKRAIDTLVPPKAKQIILWDTEVKGFGLRIMASGIKIFVVQYRNAEGIKRRMNFGRFGVLTADQVRDLAKLKLVAVIVGDDPADMTRQARQGMTATAIGDRYLKTGSASCVDRGG